MVILCEEKDTTAIQPGDTHRLKTQGGYVNGCEMLDTPASFLTFKLSNIGPGQC